MTTSLIKHEISNDLAKIDISSIVRDRRNQRGRKARRSFWGRVKRRCRGKKTEISTEAMAPKAVEQIRTWREKRDFRRGVSRVDGLTFSPPKAM